MNLGDVIIVVLLAAVLGFIVGAVTHGGPDRPPQTCRGHGGFQHALYENGFLDTVVCRDGYLIQR